MQFPARRLTAAALFVFFFAAGAVWAQTRPAAVLEYFDDELEIQILDSESFEYNNLYMGMELLPGDTVKTFNSSAEISLEPNGTIIRIAPETEITVDSLSGDGSSTVNAFSMARGRLRAVAARAEGTRYEFRLPGAVGAVRGTDFGIHVAAEGREALFVREGSVAFRARATGEEVVVSAGEIADAAADTLAVQALDAGELEEMFSDLGFTELDPAQVPQSALRREGTGAEDPPSQDGAAAQTEEASPAADAAEQEAGEAGGGEARGTGEEAAPEASAETPDGAGDGRGGDAGDAAEGGAGATAAGSSALEKLGDSLALETGAVTLSGTTYAKVVLQPQLSVGPVDARLYLPALFRENLFAPRSYFRPKGNDEWSFGSDYDWNREPLDAGRDVLTDLALKLHSLEVGDSGDPTYLRLGNLSGVSLGHGLLMHDYANDVDFPAVRRVGLDAALDTGGFGLETALNDLTEPEIAGLRVFFRPLEGTARLGLSGVVDTDPAGDLPRTPTTRTIRNVDPIVTTASADVEVALVEADLLTLSTFTDVGAFMPYLRRSFTPDGREEEEIDRGFRTEALADVEAGRLRNFAAMTGVLGNLGPVEYRLDFRTYNGLFRPFFFDRGYERRRGEVAAHILSYLSDPTAEEFDRTGAGIYGEAGIGLADDALRLRAGYLWPWEVDDTGAWTLSNFDYLTLKAEIGEGILPLGIHGSAQYERRGFYATIVERDEFADAGFFDADSLVRSELIVPVGASLEVAAVVTTTVLRNEDGTVRYEDGRPEVSNSFTVETRFGF